MLKLGIVVLALGLAGAAFFGLLPGLLRPPAATPPAVTRPPQPTLTPTAVATPAAPLDARVASFVRAIEGGQLASIVVSDEEATAVARAALARRGEERVQDLTVRFVDGQVQATATVALPGATVPVAAVVRPRVAADGTLDVRVEQVRVAGGAPPFVDGLARSFVEEQIARSLAQPEWLALRRLDVANGQLRVDGARR